jgi:signal transduction histidine kinase
LTSGLEWLAEGGELGHLIARFDWTQTPLGALEDWPQSLRTAVSLMLNSQHPMWIGWGPEATFLYNDAYISVLSRAKHPWALGRPASVVWTEIWDVCGPLADKVFNQGKASFVDDVELFMKRGDFIEETYYSFSYSPIRDERGRVGGLFCPSAEVTTNVLNARRLRTLSELSANALLEKTVDRAAATAFRTLEKNPRDVPFAALYLLDASGMTAQRQAMLGLSAAATPLVPATVAVDAVNGSSPWPVAQALASRQLVAMPLAETSRLPVGAGGQHVQSVVVLPLTSPQSEGAVGVLLAGVNPNRRLDSEYRTFFELAAGQIATAIQNARVAEEERRRAEELAELDRAKTAFFQNVSHEFRTPLTLMLGPLEDELREGNHSRERIDLAYRNALRLLKLVNTLLDFSRIEAGRFEASFEPVDLPAYTAELASVFQAAADRAGLQLRVSAAALPERVYVDRGMWEKIIFNLLSNALKFTLQGGIDVAVRAHGDHALVAVRDTGSGIAATELPQLFRRFHRVRNTSARSHEGTGIGLALVNELVRLHGGTIAVESVEGEGTTFTIQLRYGAAHLPADKVRPGTARLPATHALAYVEEAKHWRPDEPELQADATGPAGAAGARIVLADDNADMRDYVRRLLAARGHDVVAVEDGEAALAAILAVRPALVLSDVMMPRLDGFGLLKALRSDPALRTVPFIMLSARAGEEARVEGVEAGADDYLTKPFSARELLARIDTHLELARMRQQVAEAIEKERRQLHDLLMRAPAMIVVFRGPEHVVELANPLWWQSMARPSYEQFKGRPIREILPEVAEQGYLEMLDRVYTTGEPVVANEARIELTEPGGGKRVVFANFVLQATHDAAGRIDGVFGHAVDVTALHNAHLLLTDHAAHLENLVQQRTAKLRETIGELEAFSYSIAHDLRAPLRSLQGFSDVLLTEYAPQLPADAQGFLRRIGTSAGRMDKLVQDVLSYSRLVRGELAFEPVNMDVLVREIVETYPMFAPDKVDIEVVERLPEVLGNEAMLTQIVSNLVGNAVKFVADGTKPRIRISAELREGRVRLHFVDNGIGIAAENHEKIWDIFEQLNRGSGGTGIGLAIVRKAAERMGGSTGVVSAPGQGSDFWVELQAA